MRFRQLWKIIDEQYCFFEYKNIDWKAIGDKTAKKIKPQMDEQQLFAVLSEMPLYRDVSHYSSPAGSFEVPFYKRAQITCADLATAFEGRGPGAFADLDRLTVFADNLVPHVLRREGVLRYGAELLARIERGDLIDAGSAEEVEIRSAGVHAVERMCALLARRGTPCEARQLDSWLWHRGQSPRIKAAPRHRTRSVYY